MNPNNHSQNTTLLDGICRRGVLVATSVRYWRGCKRLNAEDASRRLQADLDGFIRESVGSMREETARIAASTFRYVPTGSNVALL